MRGVLNVLISFMGRGGSDIQFDGNGPRFATAQGDTDVIQLERDGIAPDQAFMQKVKPRSFDKSQLQKAAFQFFMTDIARAIMPLGYDADNDAAIAFAKVAQTQGLSSPMNVAGSRARI